jgi:hypothetical protein
VWEDACIDGLIEVVDTGEGISKSRIALTELGSAVRHGES